MKNVAKRLSRELGLGLAVCVLGALGACVPSFVQPAATDPHAVVKVRVAYHTESGPQLSQAVRIGEFAAPISSPPGSVTTPYTQALRVPPSPTTWGFRSEFFHTVSHTRQVPVQVSESYSCGTYTSTTGYGSSARSTTQTRTCTRTRTEYRTQTETQRVTDASCSVTLRHAPQAGGTYLLQYDFYGNDKCSLHCYRQTPTTDGQFKLEPCSRS